MARVRLNLPSTLENLDDVKDLGTWNERFAEYTKFKDYCEQYMQNIEVSIEAANFLRDLRTIFKAEQECFTVKETLYNAFERLQDAKDRLNKRCIHDDGSPTLFQGTTVKRAWERRNQREEEQRKLKLLEGLNGNGNGNHKH
jgi:hypothetical protein